EVLEGKEITPPELCVRVKRVLPRLRVPATNGTRARVVVEGLQLSWPHTVIARFDRRLAGAVAAAPTVEGMRRLEAIRHLATRLSLVVVVPVVAVVVVDDVEQDVEAASVGGIDHVAQVLARTEARVDVEEVLDAVAVV